jgi:hypothetical protein
MKELFAGIVLVIILGVGGFLYRNEIIRPNTSVSGVVTPNGVACTEEAKVCPDGSAVGRTGPNCSFAACPPPNAELTVGSTTLDFVLPAGYAKSTSASSDANVIAAYTQSSGGESASSITISRYTIPQGSTADEVMLANTTLDPSGLQATSTTSFKKITEGQNTFSSIQIQRYEGVVQTAYYLVQPNDVLRFDITERSVSNWTDPNLNVATLPQHQALLQMLATLQAS